MKMGIWLRKAVLFAAVLGALGAVSKTVEASASEFIRGADISILSDMEKSGAKYYEDDISKDALEILKNNGVNYVRLRLWQDPYNSNGESYGAGTNDLETTIDLAKRAKNLWDLRCCWIFTTVIFGLILGNRIFLKHGKV
ncbi:hypothetical protein EfmAA290_00360 [Enterococcus faecium]|nr:hypothetical protein EfmAA290_00360 [Enterococcus faecium]